MDSHYKYSFIQELFEVEFAQALIVVAYWGKKKKKLFLIIQIARTEIRVLPPNL